MTKPADDDSQTPERQIADAIRSKRQGKTSVAADLEALEAALIADIEAFDMRAISLAPEAPTTDALAAAQAEATKVFPEIVPEGAARPLPKEDQPPPPAAEGAGASVAPPAGVSLLQQLRQQAQAQQNDAAARKRNLTAVSKQLDECLRRVFSYCHELVQQLNILKPNIERHYAMLGSIDFCGLRWQEGFVDYRTRPHSSGSGATYEQVTLTCHLQAPEKVSIERDAIAAESFRRTLFDNAIVFTCDDFKNARGQVQKSVFSITADVKVNLRWRADLEQGVIVLESRNLERFGSRDYVLPPESVTMQMLDQFARLLLGQASQFRDYYRH